MLKGRFLITPICGLDYETQTQSGRTDENGTFQYQEGETVTFSIGGLILGSCLAMPKMTPADLSFEAAGDPDKIINRKVTNMARLLLSLNPEDRIENGIHITDDIRDICHKYRKTMYLNQPEDFFTKDEIVQRLMAELGSTLVSPAKARNYLRRAIYGIKKETDVQIPMRDGGYVLADIFRPEKEGKYPVIISFGGYGKAFWLGKEATEEEAELHAQLEDDYFRGITHETDYLSFHIASLPAGDPLPEVPGLPQAGSVPNPMMTHISETFERANVMDWVPDDYVVMHVDSRGLGNVPGEYCQFGRPEADDYYDSIEWAAAQEWSNGNVGTYGGSFYAMNAFNVASLCPPHLKAFIPLAGDMDPMRDYSGFGGLLNKFGFTPKICAGEFCGEDLAEVAAGIEFDDPEIFNEHSKVMMKGKPENIRIPYFTALSLEQAFIHTRGTSEIFINSATPIGNKYMDIVSEVGVHYWMYGKHILDRHKMFFAHWLKGEENLLEQAKPIHMMVRSGYGSYYWQDENEWPIARTEYKKLYLNAKNENDEFHKLSDTPTADGQITYPADQEAETRFVTEPLESDMTIAGYCKANLFVSSTHNDMVVLTYLYVLDEDGCRIPFVMDLNPATPVGKGGLKISHRKQDEALRTEYRPYHTHRKEDVQKLVPGEIAEAEIEILPTTARLKKGWRLEFVIMPKNSAGELFDPRDDYSEGALNTVYTGESCPSCLQIPVISKS
ncbi:MAG: CocE/NonD family hydrolase [Lachnospiraceae bacterium]|nr:CocE/NonD family hydrolase [Lachnospiraceae bacterium]